MPKQTLSRLVAISILLSAASLARAESTLYEKLGVTNAMFNALAEDVYLAFDRAGVPYRLQNKVMAIFAPMQRDMVK